MQILWRLLPQSGDRDTHRRMLLKQYWMTTKISNLSLSLHILGEQYGAADNSAALPPTLRGRLSIWAVHNGMSASSVALRVIRGLRRPGHASDPPVWSVWMRARVQPFLNMQRLYLTETFGRLEYPQRPRESC